MERHTLCTDRSAAGENVEVGVPAVSMARRRIERLRGVQFCRRTMEIRSEVSRPPDWFRTASLGNRKVSSLLLSGFGRAGATDERVCAFFRIRSNRRFFFSIRTLHHRPSSQATAGSARTRQGTLGSLDPPSAAASSDERRLFTGRRRKPRPPRRSAVNSHLSRTRNAPQRSSADHRRADRVDPCAAATACKLSLPFGRGGLGGGSPGRSGG